MSLNSSFNDRKHLELMEK